MEGSFQLHTPTQNYTPDMVVVVTRALVVVVMVMMMVGSGVVVEGSKLQQGGRGLAALLTPPVNKVDHCILTCDYCYKGDPVLLLLCANSCLQDEGKMSYQWSNTCPYFSFSVL